MTPAEFWSSTPREVAIVVEGANFRRDEGQRLAIQAGWYAAAFERQKALPELAGFMRRSESTEAQSGDQILERIKQWHLALGGDPRQLDKLKNLPKN